MQCTTSEELGKSFKRGFAFPKYSFCQFLTAKAFLSLPLKAVNSSLAVFLEVCFPQVLTLILDASLFPLPITTNLPLAENTTPKE